MKILKKSKISKKVILFLLSTLTAISVFSTSISAINFTPPVDIYSQSVYLYNLTNDQLIYEKNGDMSLQPASLTKIMTTVMVLDAFQGDEVSLANTYISANHLAFDELYGTGASTADFRIGEEASYLELLYGLLLQSACEAGNIIAMNLGDGSLETFADMMTARAHELGAVNTNFENSHGLYHPDQYTTVEDMAIILQYVYETYPLYSDITTTTMYTLPPSNKHTESRNIHTTNNLIKQSSEYYYDGITSGKTGTLLEDGSGSPEMRNLATTAEQDGIEYLLVTLGAPVYNQDGESEMFSMDDHRRIYTWAFSNLSYQTILSTTEEVAEVEVLYGQGSKHVLLASDTEINMFWPSDVDLRSIEYIIEQEESVIAPIEADVNLGNMTLKIMGQTIGEVELFTLNDVYRDELAYRTEVASRFTDSPHFIIALLSSIFILGLFILSFVLRKKKQSKARSLRRRVK